MAGTTLTTPGSLEFVELGRAWVLLEEGRRISLPAMPFPLRKADLEAYRGQREVPLEVLVEGALLALQDRLPPERVEDLRRFLFEVEPRLDQLLLARGLTQLQAGRADLARAELAALVHLCPDHAEGWSNLGVCLLELGAQGSLHAASWRREAHQALQRALELDPASAPAQFWFGCAQRDLGDEGGAAESWRRSIELAGGEGEIAREAARLLEAPPAARDVDWLLRCAGLAGASNPGLA